jgi:hypothetical protein
VEYEEVHREFIEDPEDKWVQREDAADTADLLGPLDGFALVSGSVPKSDRIWHFMNGRRCSARQELDRRWRLALPKA